MAEQFYTILTTIGKAKIANATALGIKINLTEFKVGDGGGSYYNPTESQQELKNTVWQGNISSVTIDEENPNWIVLQTIIPANIGGFMVREGGIFDNEGNLIAVGKYPETYKPVASEGSSKDVIIKMILEVSNASSVTLKVDPSVIVATKKDVEILEQKIKNIKVPVESVNSKTGAIELKAEDINCNDGKSVESHLEDIIKIKKNVILPSSGWTDDTSNSGFWVYDILDANITSDTIVDINIHLKDLKKAEDIKSSNLSTDGKVTVYSDTQPKDDIIVDLKITR